MRKDHKRFSVRPGEPILYQLACVVGFYDFCVSPTGSTTLAPLSEGATLGCDLAFSLQTHAECHASASCDWISTENLKDSRSFSYRNEPTTAQGGDEDLVVDHLQILT